MNEQSQTNSPTPMSKDWFQMAIDQKHTKPTRDKRPLDRNVLFVDHDTKTAAGELRARLLRMIVDNEKNRKTSSK